MAKVELKKPVVEEISKLLDGAAAAVLVDHRGLTVAEDTELRKTLREAGVSYKVYKNTMVTLAIKDTSFEDLSKHLEGPSALAVCQDDATAAARILCNFAKTHTNLEVKGGVVEGAYYTAAQLAELANVPSREVLVSKLLGSLQSPITNFARVLKQIAEKDAE